MAHKCQLSLAIILPLVVAVLIGLLGSLVNLMDTGSEVQILPTAPFPADVVKERIFTRLESVIYSPKNPRIERVVKKAAETLKLTDLTGFDNDLEWANRLKSRLYTAGIAFDNALTDMKEFPSKIDITLSFPSMTIQPDVTESKDDALMPFDDFCLSIYCSGFLAVQDTLSRELLREKSPGKTIPTVLMQYFPLAHTAVDDFRGTFIKTAAFFLFVIHAYPCACVAQTLLVEKNKQLKVTLAIMGVAVWLHWLAWFIKWFLFLSIGAVVVALVWVVIGPFVFTSSVVILLILLVYLIHIISFAFLISAIFMSTMRGILVCYLLYIAQYVPYIATPYNAPDIAKIIECLLLNSGMCWAFTTVQDFERSRKKLGVGTLFTPIRESLSVGTVMILMLLGSLINVILCLYFEQIRPGNIGISRKWNFPFTRKFWCPRREPGDDKNGDWDEEKGVDVRRESIEQNFEAGPKGKTIIVQAQHLTKSFHGIKVVKNFSLNLYEDELTVLLGHNGAGKTTTIMMMTGTYKPTSGRVIINGYDMATAPEKARNSLSICPQHNVLFDDLTVEQHIKFFCTIKGLEKNETNKQIQKYVLLLDLKSKAMVRSRQLSGGMKRKLSICCALCGNTRVVFCDEPSTGLDPSARHDLWSVLQKEKTGRCILLTTHYMDEAEVLADRVAIMGDGELRGYGTTFFMQQNISAGYRLICVQLEDCDVDKVTTFLKRYIPKITLERTVGTDLIYRLPPQETSKFENMFKDLEKNLEDLRLYGFGLSPSTLADAFMTIGMTKNKLPDDSGKATTWGSQTGFQIRDDIKKKEGRKCMCCDHFPPMMRKKILHTYRKKGIFLTLTLLPVAIFLLTEIIGKLLPSEKESLKLDLTLFSNAMVMFHTTATKEPFKSIAERYKSLAESKGAKIKSMDSEIDEYTKDLIKDKLKAFKKSCVGGATITDKLMLAWINPAQAHSLPISHNLLYNAIAKVLVGDDMEIGITNRPIKRESPVKLSSIFASVTLIMAFDIAVFIILPVAERYSQTKLLQIVSGLAYWNYWLTHFVWDYLIYLAIALVFVIILLIDSQSFLFDIVILLILFGLAGLPFTYLNSMLFKLSTAAFIVYSILNLLIDNIAAILMMHPMYALAESSGIIAENINKLQSDQCVDNQKGCKDDLKSIMTWRPIHFLLIEAILYFAILMLLSVYSRRLQYCLGKLKPNTWSVAALADTKEKDKDVLKEEKRVSEMTEEDIEAQNLVLDHAVKAYGKLVAVREISLAVKAYECFGLLGLNGAGKTSTFNMIVGEQLIDSGNIYIKGISVKSNARKALRHVGYCPQVDTYWNFLTGRESLHIVFQLHRVQKADINNLVEQVAKYFQFREHLDKLVRNYSGGTKRKFTSALCALGSTLMCLDEPTTGIDPAATREIWDVLTRIRDCGKSLLLTSHSMEECEALCSRLAIMVNGQFCCLGSLQHIKSRFSMGMVIQIKVSDKDELDRAKANMKRESQARPDQPDIGKSKSASRSLATTPIQSEEEEEATTSNAISSSTSGENKHGDHERSTKRDKKADEKKKRGSASPTKPDKKVDKVDKPDSPSTSQETVKSNKTEDGSDNLEALIDKVVKNFTEKFPDIQVVERNGYRGMVTMHLPNKDVKWSEIFGYLEKNREKLQILSYSIAQTSLQEIFIKFAHDQK
ncbi:ATP-binding cassette sub-family A member 3-like [Scaptodrosophila lebanonensis]|uniref:ATP-binding cassette sub-family A member 3-like n=1 Tax=Drosophila lebanonensis TaxID=7225 RepID=A0A6J2U187_DROLE|nr:ATP-binding cassette sub-family A member 3-like [Scaptodrosophila lebanonensis]